MRGPTNHPVPIHCEPFAAVMSSEAMARHGYSFVLPTWVRSSVPMTTSMTSAWAARVRTVARVAASP
jgi:hypothetical protein